MILIAVLAAVSALTSANATIFTGARTCYALGRDFPVSGISLFILRSREPLTLRPFRVPLYPLTPLIFCMTCLYLLYSSVVYTGYGAFVGIAVLLAGLFLFPFIRRPGSLPGTQHQY